ncbi:MAG: hypothetical protein LHW64_06445 [Candidatus Cloacimonetes bacterium]|jgi:hypothetical protein|nr:hypothetical protein [Candidatus Cloacimonadota bacterium]MCB5287423.1 hypothetical protein [Candidatus Cloacimonadota bacterium]MCK9184209.1 hypothetical protein [Candidatus Cloacimonadota bacterium]MCK9583657.1 hypothetical protein [Candidatus Cloacimonadota bacterium]MDY0229744.1 hypothetical protein [Candidatus Cloacimonadaceae bacterium]
MKKIILIQVLILLIALAFAQPVGSVRFFIGTVEYQENQNQAFKAVCKDMPVALNGNLKTALAASVEILWSDGTVSTVEQNKNVSIRAIYEEASAKTNWNTKLKRQVKNLRLTKDGKASSVAGIRRTEAEVEEKADLFWGVPKMVDVDEALGKYEEEKYLEAMPLLLKVIEQDPLNHDAEISHLALILIYEELGEIAKRDKQITILKKDFPSSQFIQDLPGH